MWGNKSDLYCAFFFCARFYNTIGQSYIIVCMYIFAGACVWGESSSTTTGILNGLKLMYVREEFNKSYDISFSLEKLNMTGKHKHK